MNGIQLAVDEVNEAGGVLGRQIEIIAEDGKCNGTDALTAYTKLVDVDDVPIILAHLAAAKCWDSRLGWTTMRSWSFRPDFQPGHFYRPATTSSATSSVTLTLESALPKS